MSHALMKIVRTMWARQRNATMRAVRHVGRSLSIFVGSPSSRGKKMRNSSNLHMLAICFGCGRACEAHIAKKHDHCTPTCAMPSIPAKHSNVLTIPQHATSARDAGRTSILAKAHVPDIVPSRMKYGEIPSDVRREMMR